jgi:tetratricopeptide (TPR) repeat protein
VNAAMDQKHDAVTAAPKQRLIGNYEVIATLGHGGMGEVLHARDLRLGRSVALKFLPQASAPDRTALDRFFLEARAASALNHPNIVTIYDIGDAEGVPFIAMELIQGRTVRAVASESLSLEQLAKIGAQVAEALAVAHKAGIVHRDIKPENIMVRDDGYAKILDFGLARVLPFNSRDTAAETQAATNPGTFLGTFRYASPEQARAEPVTAATDIFSLGIVLYELSTGKHPFEADSQLATLHGILSQPCIPLSHHRIGIPSALETTIFRMLEKDPRLRPSAEEVHTALAELAGKSPAATEAAPIVVTSPRRVVGRTKQVSELSAAFDGVGGGRGLMVCLAGEPGLGKTTLVEDFLSDLAARGVACCTARGRCSERLGDTEAYLPFLEALESLFHGGSADTVARIMKVMAPTWYVQIAPLTGEDSSRERALSDTKSASQERMKRELAAFLQEISRIQPLVIFFDDLHWADNATVDLLSYIGVKIGAMRLLLVATYRPSELLAGKHPLLQVKLDMQSHGVCREIALGFLTREDIDCYLALEFPENRFPPELSSLIHLKTEGNALFMADMVRYLRARGVIAEQQGSWMVVESLPDIQGDLPESVRSMIQRKIDSLSDADRRLLMAASVQGQEFDSGVVAKVVGLDPAEVEERLDILDRVHAFVRLVGERELPDSTLTLRCAFVHSLYQNALYSAVTVTRRISWSATVAEELLSHYGDRSAEIAAELALLFEVARDFGRAAEYFVAAGKNASGVCANQEAIDLFERAISNAGKLRDLSRQRHVYNAATQLGLVYDTQTRMSESADAFRVAANAADEMNDPAAQVQAMCGAANALFLSKRVEESRQECERAYELARHHNLGDLVASIDAVHSLERLSAGDFDTALESYDRALGVLRNRELSAVNLPGITFRGGLHVWRLEHREAEQFLGWTMQSARDLGVRGRILTNLFFQTISLGHQGRVGEALETMREARGIAELNGERFVLARIPNTFGWLHRELFDLERALELDLEGIRLAQQVVDHEAEISSRINAGQVHLLLGEHQQAFEHLQGAEFLLDRFNWFTWVFRIRLEAELASYSIAKGDLQSADGHVSNSLAIASRALCRKHMAWGLKLKADIAALDDRVDHARDAYEAALGVLAHHPCPPIEWQIRKAYAELFRRTSETAAGDDQIRHARSLVNSLADSVPEERLRKVLLASRPARDLF